MKPFAERQLLRTTARISFESVVFNGHHDRKMVVPGVLPSSEPAIDRSPRPDELTG